MLLGSTGLTPFRDRPAGKLSGGMQQKLGLCCALIHDPDLLILDEPTTGVDPLSRRQFWDLVERIRSGRPGMSVLMSTAYMEEAARFAWLVAMDAGCVLATGTPQELLARSGAAVPVWEMNLSMALRLSQSLSMTGGQAGCRSAGAASLPTTAVAAATAGDTRCVFTPGPCRPSKLRFDVDALR